MLFLFGLYLLKPIKKITVMEYQQALLYVNGRFKRILPAGHHWVCGSTKVTLVDMREQLVTIPGQEILTSDNITAKISLAMRYKIVDPLKAEHSCKNYIESLYSIMQIKLRELVCASLIEDLVKNKNILDMDLNQFAKEKTSELGLEIIAINLKDISLSTQIKNIFSQELRAKKEGLASLEKARSETAVLRNLVNTSKLLVENPGLSQLRVIQALSDTAGHSVVIHLDPVQR